MKFHKNSRFMKICTKIPSLWNFHNITKFVKFFIKNCQIYEIYVISKKKVKIMKIYSKMPIFISEKKNLIFLALEWHVVILKRHWSMFCRNDMSFRVEAEKFHQKMTCFLSFKNRRVVFPSDQLLQNGQNDMSFFQSLENDMSFLSNDSNYSHYIQQVVLHKLQNNILFSLRRQHPSLHETACHFC